MKTRNGMNDCNNSST
ncbi:hypothetical protein CGLO_13543 [Colletotrichum gloeosporioides Cg-14]|uniref:Uncharacterized protein n=1 Tax=Colletotrichum gloeosporioides (strain Cg-14) TaxID=1237896 RepID=T0L6X7_COLGC|nr:hypothetical protein CGLO_13543 [Colletotrichum gloeosporioides Cg-14]